jgi:hypothetical protein
MMISPLKKNRVYYTSNNPKGAAENDSAEIIKAF